MADLDQDDQGQNFIFPLETLVAITLNQTSSFLPLLLNASPVVPAIDSRAAFFMGPLTTSGVECIERCYNSDTGTSWESTNVKIKIVSSHCFDSFRDCQGGCLLQCLTRLCGSNETSQTARASTDIRNTLAEPTKCRLRITDTVFSVTGPSISDLHKSFSRLRGC